MSTYRSDDEAVTLDQSRAGVDQQSGSESNIFAEYGPPFDLTSDMLFALALCHTRPLSLAFPSVPFLSLLGKTPLLLWFSRINEICYYNTVGVQHCIGRPSAALYHELNVAAFLRERTLFVPGIYATSDLTIRVGHGYGMPKQAVTMQIQVECSQFRSEMQEGTRQSFVRARLLGSGIGATRLITWLLPSFTWPVHFPSGSQIRALITKTSRMHLAHLQAGSLALETEWLPKSVRLLPVGCYMSDLHMQLPSLEGAGK